MDPGLEIAFFQVFHDHMNPECDDVTCHYISLLVNYISLLVIPCIIYYVTNKETLNP